MSVFPTVGTGDAIVFDLIRLFFACMQCLDLLDRSLSVLQVICILSAESVKGGDAEYACSSSCEIDPREHPADHQTSFLDTHMPSGYGRKESCRQAKPFLLDNYSHRDDEAIGNTESQSPQRSLLWS